MLLFALEFVFVGFGRGEEKCPEAEGVLCSGRLVVLREDDGVFVGGVGLRVIAVMFFVSRW